MNKDYNTPTPSPEDLFLFFLIGIINNTSLIKFSSVGNLVFSIVFIIIWIISIFGISKNLKNASLYYRIKYSYFISKNKDVVHKLTYILIIAFLITMSNFLFSNIIYNKLVDKIDRIYFFLLEHKSVPDEVREKIEKSKIYKKFTEEYREL